MKFCGDNSLLLQVFIIKMWMAPHPHLFTSIILNVLMENYGSGPIRTSDALKWARTYGLTFPVLADTFWGVFDPYYAFPGVRRIPNNVLLDKAGVIRLKKLGFTATVKAQLEAKIQQLLDE